MGILLRVIKFVFFVAVILAVGQIKVGGTPLAELLTTKVASAWKSGPEPWIRQSSAHIESEYLRKWMASLGISTERPHRAPPPKRGTRPRPVIDDIEARDQARLKTLLEKEL